MPEAQNVFSFSAPCVFETVIITGRTYQSAYAHLNGLILETQHSRHYSQPDNIEVSNGTSAT